MNGLHEAQVSPITLPLLRRFSRRPRQTLASFRTTWTLRFGSWGEKDPSRGVSGIPHAAGRKPPIAGGRTPRYGSHLGKESGVCCIAGKGGRLCRVTPARTATSAACSRSRSSWYAKAAGRRYPWERGRARHAGAPPLRRRSSSPPRLHPQIELLDRIDELLARMDAKLCVHVFHVAFRRVLRDDQLVGNVSDRPAARK